MTDTRVYMALVEVRRLRDDGLLRLHPGEYVYLMDDSESGDEGQRIAYIDLDGTLVPVAEPDRDDLDSVRPATYDTP